MSMIHYALWIAAAFFNSCMDAFENTPNFNESIFKGWDKRFWCKDVSWEYARVLSFRIPFTKKRIGSYKLDAWHISKSLMVICFAVGTVVAVISKRPWHVDVVFLGVIWGVTFWVVYHKIFGIK